MYQTIATAGGPVFLLVVLGYVLAWRKVMDLAAQRALNRLAMWVLMPASLMYLLSHEKLADIFDPALWGAFYGAVALVAVVAVAVLRLLFRCSLPETAVLMMASTFSNLVLLGFPIVEGAYGRPGLTILLIVVSIHAAVLVTVTVLMAEWGLSGGGSWKALRKTLSGVIRNPVLLGIAAGVVLSLTGLRLPAVLDQALGRIQGAVTPLSLLLVGSGLYGVRLRGDLRISLFLAAAKTLLLPLLVFCLGRFVFALPPFTVTVCTVIACMPTGANTTLMAGTYRLGENRVASSILIGTAISLTVAPVLIAILGP